MGRKGPQTGPKDDKRGSSELVSEIVKSLPDPPETEDIEQASTEQAGALDKFAAGYLANAVGLALKKWRDRSGLTLQQVGSEAGLGIKVSYLSQVERGKLPTPRLDTIYRLAIHYGVPSWELVNELAAIFNLLSELDAKSERHEEIDRAFDYVRSMPDFPSQQERNSIDSNELSAVSSPKAKLVVVLLYERASGLRVLPRSDLQEGPALGSGKVEEGTSDDD